MKTKYHIEITKNILEKYFNQNILKKIIKANILQDRIMYQFGHDYIHFDGCAFSEGFKYIHSQESLLLNSVDLCDYDKAWASTGRILHSWQDFYSHSNYTQLWLQKTNDPDPEMIDHDDPDILNHPNLSSGKNYGLIEFIALIPCFSIFIKPLMPADSHAKMNLDSPKSSPYFIYPFTAASKRTDATIDHILSQLNNQEYEHWKINAYLGK